MTVIDSPETREAPPSRLRRLLGTQTTVLVVFFVVAYIYFFSKNHIFFSLEESSNLITDMCGALLIAVAETFVITSGGIDLSVGSTVCISGVVGAIAMNHLIARGGSMFTIFTLGTVVCCATGAAVGAINALLITKAKLVPFVATLVTLSAGEGLALVVTGGVPEGDYPKAIIWGSARHWVFTWPDVAVLVVAVVTGLYLHKTRFGRYNFAIGSNDFAARAAGINVNRHISGVYILSGALAGLTGMFFYFRLGSGAPTTGIGTELDAIAAVVIGGAALTGGFGRMWGTVLGAMVLTMVTDGLIFVNVPATWEQVVVAGFIAVAAILQSIRSSVRRFR